MFKILAWIIFFYLLYKVLKNLLGPLFLGHSRSPQQPFYKETTRKEGSTTIHKTQTYSNKKDDEDDAEYIDYKEIKD